MHIVIAGDPINGFVYYGPFDSKEDAERYIEQGNVDDDPAWHVMLTAPEAVTDDDN